MMPSTPMTAILVAAPFSSVLTSSSRGPTELERAAFIGTKLLRKWLMLASTLIPSKTRSTRATTIQPRPRRRGGVEEGGTMTGGGVNGGGGGAAGGGGEDGGGGFSNRKRVRVGHK